MEILAVGAMKGGVGKTMLSVNIASVLALEYDKKVLFVDADPQANSTNYLDIDEFQENYFCIKDAIEQNISPGELIKNTYIENLKLIGSSIYLTATELFLFQQPARENRLNRYINNYKDFFNKFDYIIFDTNPSMSVINQNVFTAVDKIIVVTEASKGGAKGVDLFIDLWSGIADNLGIDNKIEALILNRFVANTNLGKEFKNYLTTGEYSEIILKNFISESTVFKDAESYSRAVALYRKNSKYHKQLLEVVKELFNRKVL